MTLDNLKATTCKTLLLPFTKHVWTDSAQIPYMNGAPPKMKDLANVSQYLPDNIDN
jgi:hypothetical protein